VSVIGDWCNWDGRQFPMRRLGDFGIWELFIPVCGERAVQDSSCARAKVTSA